MMRRLDGLEALTKAQQAANNEQQIRARIYRKAGALEKNIMPMDDSNKAAWMNCGWASKSQQ